MTLWLTRPRYPLVLPPSAPVDPMPDEDTLARWMREQAKRDGHGPAMPPGEPPKPPGRHPRIFDAAARVEAILRDHGPGPVGHIRSHTSLSADQTRRALDRLISLGRVTFAMRSTKNRAPCKHFALTGAE